MEDFLHVRRHLVPRGEYARFRLLRAVQGDGNLSRVADTMSIIYRYCTAADPVPLTRSLEKQ